MTTATRRIKRRSRRGGPERVADLPDGPLDRVRDGRPHPQAQHLPGAVPGLPRVDQRRGAGQDRLGGMQRGVDGTDVHGGQVTGPAG